jgi:hypothetical protein
MLCVARLTIAVLFVHMHPWMRRLRTLLCRQAWPAPAAGEAGGNCMLDGRATYSDGYTLTHSASESSMSQASTATEGPHALPARGLGFNPSDPRCCCRSL